jgi:hypothetical protein
MSKVFLIPPKNPLSGKATDRRWQVQVNTPGMATVTDLYGTDITRPDEAKEKANCHLGRDIDWVPTTGLGFKEKETGE